MVGLKNGRIRLAKCIMTMTNPPKYYNTQNRDDHCAYHTNTLSYYKLILHFVKYASKLFKVVLEVRYSQSSREGIFFSISETLPLRLDNKVPHFPDGGQVRNIEDEQC